MKIVGYTKPVVAHTGEDIDCMVSTTAGGYKARLVRLTRGMGPVVTDGFSTQRELTGRLQPYRCGSFLRAQLPDWPVWLDGSCLQCWVYPTALGGQQCLIALSDESGGWELRLDDGAFVWCRVGPDGTESFVVVSPLQVRPQCWYFVGAAIDVDGRRTGLAAAFSPVPGRSCPPLEPTWAEAATTWSTPNMAIVAAGVTNGEVVRHFNGKIDSPRIFSRCLLDSELEALASGADPRSIGGLAAAWSFDPLHDTNTGTVEILARCVPTPSS